MNASQMKPFVETIATQLRDHASVEGRSDARTGALCVRCVPLASVACKESPAVLFAVSDVAVLSFEQHREDQKQAALTHLARIATESWERRHDLPYLSEIRGVEIHVGESVLRL